MPDPAWTQQYNFAQTPENNGFTRQLYNSPVITLTQGGNPANRNVNVDSTAGDAVFLTSSVPSLSSSIGATAEMIVAVSGAAEGDAGIELTFLDRAVLVLVFPNKVSISICNDIIGNQESEYPTASNSGDTTIRVTFDSNKDLRVYRNAILLAGPLSTANCVKPFQRVLWWVETGAIGTFKALRYYLGGAVVPG